MSLTLSLSLCVFFFSFCIPGKTALARGLSKVLGCKKDHVQLVNATEVFGKYVGESEGNVRKWFAPSKAAFRAQGDKSPIYILIIDEIDAMLPVRGSSGGNGWRDTVVNQFLADVDGLEQCDNLIVVGMTNRIDSMDPACLRPGRFGCKVEVGYPKEEQRIAIFRAYYERLLKSDTDEAEVRSKAAAEEAERRVKTEKLEAKVAEIANMLTKKLKDDTSPQTIASVQALVDSELAAQTKKSGANAVMLSLVRKQTSATIAKASGMPQLVGEEEESKEQDDSQSSKHVNLFTADFVAGADAAMAQLAQLAVEFSGADIEGVFCRAVNAHLSSRLAQQASEDEDMEAAVATSKAQVQQIDMALLSRLVGDIVVENARIRNKPSSSSSFESIDLSSLGFELLQKPSPANGKRK